MATAVGRSAGTASSTETATNGDGGAASSATLWYPLQISGDSNGNMYITDYGNYKIRKYNLNSKVVTLFAGE